MSPSPAASAARRGSERPPYIHTDRFGQRAVARTGGATTAAGMGAALLLPSVPGTIAGFALAGFGVATLVPAAMHGADELPGLRAGTGLTVVSWLMRLGFLVSPPVVGLVADAVGLRVGLLVVPLAGTLVLVLAGVLSAARVPAGGHQAGGAPDSRAPRIRAIHYAESTTENAVPPPIE